MGAPAPPIAGAQTVHSLLTTPVCKLPTLGSGSLPLMCAPFMEAFAIPIYVVCPQTIGSAYSVCLRLLPLVLCPRCLAVQLLCMAPSASSKQQNSEM